MPTRTSRLIYWVLVFCSSGALIYGGTLGAAESVNIPPIIFGVGTHFAQNKGVPGTSLSLIRQANIKSIRDEVYWSQVERQKGIYTLPSHVPSALDLAIRTKLAPLIVLDYGNRFYDGGGMPVSDVAQSAFADYAEFVAGYFKGRVHYYEVWNEWNVGAGNANTPDLRADTVAYVRLLAKTSAAIKRVDPSAVVLGGAAAGWAAGWIEDMMREGGARYLDGVSIHPYSYNGGWNGRPEALLDWLKQLGQNIQRYSNGKAIPLYITEVGWPNYEGKYNTRPKVSADYLSRLLLLASTNPFIRGIWWYDFQDDGNDPRNVEDNFGLIRNDGSPKPAYFSMGDVLEFLNKAQSVASETVEPGIYVLQFKRSDGTSGLAAWTDRQNRSARLTFRFPAGASNTMETKPAGSRQPFQKVPVSISDRTITIPVTGTPWLIQGTFDSVGIDVSWQ
jgi:polysaccharide biosynthesis protein PslG